MRISVYIIIIIILLFLKPDALSAMNNEYIFMVSLIYVGVLIFFLANQRRYSKNWLRFDFLFLLGYTILHFQIPFLASIGIDPARPDLVYINKRRVNFALWMSIFAIVLWMLGYSLYLQKRSLPQALITRSPFPVNYKLLDTVLFTFLLLFIILVGPQFLGGVYDGGRSYGVGAEYAQLLLRVLLYLRIVYFFHTFKPRSTMKVIITKALSYKIFLLVLLTYTLLYLRVGDRGPIMQVLLVVAGSYAFFIKPISLNKIIIFSIIGSVFFSILNFGRSRDTQDFGDQNIIERGYESYIGQKEKRNPTEELATSVRIQYRAFDIVPDRHPYFYGLTLFTTGVGSIVPFANDFIFKPIGIPSHYLASSTFLNTFVKGANYSSGDGTEILSDIYINFGVYGTFIVMFGFGWFAAKVYNKAHLMHFSFILISIVLIYNGIYINRAMLFTPLKDIVYILVAHLIFKRNFKPSH